jgi:hypothetical protein
MQRRKPRKSRGGAPYAALAITGLQAQLLLDSPDSSDHTISRRGRVEHAQVAIEQPRLDLDRPAPPRGI